MLGPDEAEMTLIQGGNLRHSKTFGNCYYRCVNESKVSVSIPLTE